MTTPPHSTTFIRHHTGSLPASCKASGLAASRKAGLSATVSQSERTLGVIPSADAGGGVSGLGRGIEPAAIKREEGRKPAIVAGVRGPEGVSERCDSVSPCMLAGRAGSRGVSAERTGRGVTSCTADPDRSRNCRGMRAVRAEK
jgi:hypothetical protein